MRSVDWPYPSVLAGSLRTILGKKNGRFSEDTITRLLEINIAGPLPMKGRQLFLPVPKDISAKDENGNLTAIPLRPVILEKDEVCDFPNSGLLPAMIPGNY